MRERARQLSLFFFERCEKCERSIFSFRLTREDHRCGAREELSDQRGRARCAKLPVSASPASARASRPALLRENEPFLPSDPRARAKVGEDRVDQESCRRGKNKGEDPSPVSSVSGRYTPASGGECSSRATQVRGTGRPAGRRGAAPGKGPSRSRRSRPSPRRRTPPPPTGAKTTKTTEKTPPRAKAERGSSLSLKFSLSDSPLSFLLPFPLFLLQKQKP